MASIIPVGDKWRAQIRRVGHATLTETFAKKTQAQAWARQIEADMDRGKHDDSRSNKDHTVATLIQRYRREIEPIKPFARTKAHVLKKLEEGDLGSVTLDRLNDSCLTKYVLARRSAGVCGVTIATELSYLSGVLQVAKSLWKIPARLEYVREARASMKYLNLSTQSKERTRRPTADELSRLGAWFDKHSTLPMRDIIEFAVQTSMRISEITRIQWSDLDREARTVVIRDRKHPREKAGNNQEVPLLGTAMEIILRQGATDERIFPCNTSTITNIFPRACQALGIEDLHLHDLRHEGISRLFEQGYQIHQVAIVSGHRDWKMLKRYTQLKAADLHRHPSQARSLLG